MTASFFVDTNVLVYARDSSEPEKQPRARDWLEHLWRERCGRLSAQVLNEYYVTVTRKLDPGMDPPAARGDVRALTAWRPIESAPEIRARAWAVEDRWGFSWWDSLIIASAQQLGCTYLLSEDLQHDQELEELRVIDPFRLSPADIG